MDATAAQANTLGPPAGPRRSPSQGPPPPQGPPPSQGARFHARVPDVTLDQGAQAYRRVVDDLGLDVADHRFDGRAMEHDATWPLGPFGADRAEGGGGADGGGGRGGPSRVACTIRGERDAVVWTLDVEGPAERLGQVLRALKRHGVPVDRARPVDGAD